MNDPLNVLTALLVLATIALAWVGWKIGERQIALMGGSLRATQQAASAAEEGAKHARATERPWVAVFAEDEPEKDENGKVIWAGVMNVLNNWRQLPEGSERVYTMRIGWSASNYGKSPARVVGAAIGFECREWPLPPQPTYDPGERFAPMPLPPNGGRPIHLRAAFDLRPENRAAFNKGKKAVVLFGFITYLDTLDEEHTTRFCWVWQVDQSDNRLQFGADGPPAWHQYT